MTLRYPPSTHSHTHRHDYWSSIDLSLTTLCWKKNIYLNKAWNESVQSSISSFTLFLPYLKSSGISNLKLLPSSLWMKLNHTERQWLILSEHSAFHSVYLPSYIAQSITTVCSFMRKENANKCMCVTSTSHWKPNITHCVFQSSYCTCVDTNISAHQCSSYTPTAVCLITHEIWSQSLTSPKSPTFYMLCLLLSHSIDPIMKMLRNLRICLIKYQIKWSDLIFISVYLQNPSQVRFLSAFLSLSMVQIKDQSFIWEMRLSPLSSVWCIPMQSGGLCQALEFQ